LFLVVGPMNAATPVSLLERLRQPNDPAAWARFIELYTPLLYFWARRLGVASSDAADLVQEVFALLLRKLPEFHYDRRQSFRAWLHTVTLNKWRETLRQRAAQPATAAWLSEVAGPDVTIQLEEAEYRQHLVHRALQVMQSDFQASTWQAFWQCAVDDRPAGAVAAALGITVKAVYQAKARVLRRLRQELDGLLD